MTARDSFLVTTPLCYSTENERVGTKERKRGAPTTRAGRCVCVWSNLGGCDDVCCSPRKSSFANGGIILAPRSFSPCLVAGPNRKQDACRRSSEKEAPCQHLPGLFLRPIARTKETAFLPFSRRRRPRRRTRRRARPSRTRSAASWAVSRAACGSGVAGASARSPSWPPPTTSPGIGC